MWDAESSDKLASMSKELKKLFARRLGAEMAAQGMSIHTVVRIAKTLGHAIGKSSVARILKCEQDPTLEKVEILADVVGLPSWALLMEAGQIEQRIIRPAQKKSSNVVQLPDPYPSPFRNRDAPSAGKSARRKSAR